MTSKRHLCSLVILLNCTPYLLLCIKNLVENSLVKITTVDGSFVTHFYSEGGQAVWDCTNINGDKVSPGVYLIFVSDRTGKETFATKILIM